MMINSSNTQRLLIIAASCVALLPCVATAQAPQPSEAVGRAEAAQASPQGAINGRVVSDSGNAVEGASVFLRMAGPNRSTHTAFTDEEGRFNVEGLAAGQYHVLVLAPGYVMAERPAEERQETLYRPGDTADITLYKGGVITGAVTDARGEPVVGTNVRAIRVRDALGKSVAADTSSHEGQTDDRGVYRLYGLAAGSYLVAAGGAARFRTSPDPYRFDAPTFYPSGTRDGAAEVRVDLGLEAKGIDVRYRGGTGYALSGTVSGLPAGATIWLTLNYSGTNVTFANATATRRDEQQSFAFYGVPEGEYTLQALGAHFASQSSAFATRQVTVKGADVTGLNISLVLHGSIAGRIRLEKNKHAGQGCQGGADGSTSAIVLTARRDEKAQGRAPQSPTPVPAISDRTDEAGEFFLRGLEGGLYRLETQVPSKEFYVGSITFHTTVAPQASKPADAAREGLAVKSGEKIEGVTVTLFDGAASLQGRVTAQSNAPAPTRLYLVPAEREAADDVLRYAEAAIAADGSFALTNLAPGRYRVFTRATPGGSDAQTLRPAAWDAEGRVRLRREAEAANVSLELRPCQQVQGYAIRQP